MLRELLVFSPKENGHNTDFLFLFDDMTNTYASIPQNWHLIDSDGAEERGDVVGSGMASTIYLKADPTS